MCIRHHYFVLGPKILFVTTCVTLVSVLCFFLMSVSPHWAVLLCDNNVVGVFGVFWYWAWHSNTTSCKDSVVDANTSGYRLNRYTDSLILSLTIMAMGFLLTTHGFAVFTNRQPRYTFKRLTGILYILSAAVMLGLTGSFPDASHLYVKALPLVPSTSLSTALGSCYYMTHVVILIQAGAGIIFLSLSGKQKLRTNIDTEQPHAEQLQAMEDEPIILS